MKRVASLRLAAVFLAAALVHHPLIAADVPTPPAGFSWQQIPEMKAAFLKPDGWFFKHETTKGTEAYFLTKEDISKGGEFATGLTVNVFRLHQDSAVDHGRELIEKMAAQHHEKSWSRTVGPFQEFGISPMKDTDATGTIVMTALTIANPKTNALYFFIFESPESSWESAWKLGKPIMDALAIDDEY
jgi:hypothetical protein